MRSPIINRSFARLFKKYRLRSEIETLSEFGDLLAEQGFVYENSIFTHWQKGTRVPHERKILLAIVHIFVCKGALSTIDQVNEILASLNMRDLTIEESIQFPGMSPKIAPFTVPEEIEFFVGRNGLVKQITAYLLEKFSVILYGQAGSGKSSLCIHIAHTIRKQFSDGILWYRYDIMHKEDILLDIGKEFNLDLSKEITLENKAKSIRELLAKKNILLILDNVDSYEEVRLLFRDKKFPCVTIITSRVIPPKNFESYKAIAVKGFTGVELQEYARILLGNAFLLSNKEKISDLGKAVEYSPLLLSVLFKQIEQEPSRIDYYLQKLETFPLQSVYDKKTIESSLKLSFDTLSSDVQEIFVSLGIFQGSDFSPNVVAVINKKSVGITKAALSELQRHSLIEFSIQNRYRLHPLIKLYLQNKIDEGAYSKKLAEYYLSFLGQKDIGKKSEYSTVVEELDNIIGVFQLCDKYGSHTELNNLWNYMGVFFWDTGRWNKLNKYGEVIHKYKDTYENTLVYITYIFFVIFTIWWIYIFLFSRNDQWGRSLFSCTYTVIAIWGGIIGLIIGKKWGGLQSLMGKSVSMFSIGLLFQSFGQIAYGYFMIFYAPYKFMYPSLGDIGYFGSIFFYIYGAFLILKSAKAKNTVILMFQKFTAIIIPLLLLTISYVFFLNGYKPDFSHPFTLFLDFAYPLSQSICLFLAILAFIYSTTLSTGLMKQRIRVIIFALVSQYIADYVFLFSLKKDITKPGDFVDYLYLFAYFIMTLAILQFRTIQGDYNSSILCRLRHWFKVNLLSTS